VIFSKIRMLPDDIFNQEILQYLTLNNLGLHSLILDASIVSISENCTGLKILKAIQVNITDASFIAIAMNCTELQKLVTVRYNLLSHDKLRSTYLSVSIFDKSLHLRLYLRLQRWSEEGVLWHSLRCTMNYA
jgi:hypothetical protein